MTPVQSMPARPEDWRWVAPLSRVSSPTQQWGKGPSGASAGATKEAGEGVESPRGHRQRVQERTISHARDMRKLSSARTRVMVTGEGYLPGGVREGLRPAGARLSDPGNQPPGWA
jgi:hypothetical protein